MYISDINLTKENLIIYYPSLYISDYTTKIVNINQTILTGFQNLEKNNSITIVQENNIIINLIKEN